MLQEETKDFRKTRRVNFMIYNNAFGSVALKKPFLFLSLKDFVIWNN